MNAPIVKAGFAAPRLFIPRLFIVAVAAGVLAACSVTQVTRERVDRSQTVVQQADQTVGRSESGALELQQARDHLSLAQRAVADGHDQEATREATLATLTAELAVSKSQSASARKAADELTASIESLRREAAREQRESGSTPPR